MMNKKNLTLRSFTLVAAMLVAMNLWAGVKQAYAVYQSYTHTLVFYYDDQKDQKDGWVLNVYTGRRPDWYGSNLMEDVQSVTIDESFADYKPKNGSYLFSFLRGVSWFNNLEYLDTREMTNMEKMFYECGMESAYLNLDLRTFDTQKVTTMKDMFYECKHLETVDLSSFDTQHVTDMRRMFSSCNNLTTIYVGNQWTTVSLSPAQQQMFGNNHQLVGGAGTTYDGSHVESDYARIDQGTSAPGYLTYKALTYNLWIGNTQVDENNCGNITSDEILAGSISYDPDTKTLTLRNVNYEGELPGITIGDPNKPSTPDIKGLTIDVKSNCNFRTTAANKEAFYQNAEKVTITGPGHLRMRSDQDCGMELAGDLLLRDADVQVVGKNNAIVGKNYHGGLTIDHSTLVAYSLTSSDLTILNVSMFELIDSHFSDVELAGTTYDGNLFYFEEEDHTVWYGDRYGEAIPWQKEVYVTPDVIPRYNLCVKDIQLDDRNIDDILGDGTVSFDAETNTLTLDNADITNTGNEGYGICNYYGDEPLTYEKDIDHLTINVLGHCKIATDDVCLYINRADMTIKGPGKLSLTSSYEEAINAVICGLTLKNADVVAKGSYSAIKGTGSEMVVDHSALVASSTKAINPTIYDFNAFQLVNSAFIDVFDGYSTFYGSYFYYDDGACEMRYKGNYDNDGVADYYNDAYRWGVLISPTGAVTAIDSPEVQDIEASPRPAYNLSGQRIAEGYRGIIVRDGKKYLKK